MQERFYLSRYSSETFGQFVYVGGVLGDADGVVTVQMVTDDTSATQIFSRAATHVGVGDYTVTISSAEAATPGYYQLLWSYSVSTIAQMYGQDLEVGQSSPAYDALAEPMKAIVEAVWIRFADGFDYQVGGVHLQSYAQSGFGRGRLAQLMKTALGKLNTCTQPVLSYTLDGVGGALFPLAPWGPVLESALYVEFLRHLVRAYTEQPDFMSGSSISRLDRRDYMDRWQNILAGEEPVLLSQVETFKISNMGLGKPRVLVSGGAYGRFGPNRLPLSAAARPRYSTRFYG